MFEAELFKLYTEWYSFLGIKIVFVDRICVKDLESSDKVQHIKYSSWWFWDLDLE